MENLTAVKWSYLAGLLDGEGTVCITTQTQNGLTVYTLQVKIANTSLELMQWLISNFGGSYQTCNSKNQKNPRVAVQYSWTPKGKKNRDEVLRCMLPYLVIKRQRALIGLEFDGIYGRNGNGNGIKLTRGQPLYEENHKKRTELRDQLVKLNHRGKI